MALFAQNEDCPIAHDLVSTATNLSNGFSLTVDSLTGPGQPDSVNNIICIGPPDEDMNGPISGTALPFGSPEDKSFWFSFKAATSGTFEMLITPDNLEGDFDFMIWEGDCPSNPCSVPLFCGWQPSDIEVLPDGNIVEIGSPTGLSSDLTLDNTSTQIWAPITLKENTNYFILLDHRRPLLNPTDPYPNIGCEVTFGGTAIIEPTREAPKLLRLFPTPNIDTVFLGCIGTSEMFELDLDNFEQTVEYTWEDPSGNISMTTEEEKRFTIQESGQVCVSISCPIQETICWNVEVNEPPKLEALNPVFTSCAPLMIEDYVRDTSASPSSSPFNLLNNAFQLIDISNITNEGDYIITKTNGICPSNPIQISVTSPFPELVATTIETCASLPLDLETSTIKDQIDELNGFKDDGTLTINFYADSTQAVNDDMPITMAPSYGRYWAKSITGNGCSSNVVRVDIENTMPTINVPSIDASCDQLDLSTVVLEMPDNTPFPQSQIQYFDDLADVDDPSKARTTPIVNNSGTFYANITINPTCSTSIELDVTINQSPILEALNPVMTPSCTLLTIEDYVRDISSSPSAGSFNLFDSSSTPVDLANIGIEGDYTITKSNGTCISNSIPITVNPSFPELIPTTIRTCASLPLNLDTLTIKDQIDEINGFKAIGDLDIFFYADSLQAVNEDSPITMAPSYGRYWAIGMNAEDCPSNVVRVDIENAMPDIDIPIIPPSCGQFDLSTVVLEMPDNTPFPQNQIQYFDNLADVNDPSKARTTPIVSSSGTFYASIAIDADCSFSVDLNVVINQNPTIEPIMDVDFCDTYNLEDANVVETNGITIDREYFNSEAEANALIAIVIDPLVDAADTYWIRGTDPTNDCFSVVSVTLNTNEPSINGINTIDACGDAYDLNTIIPSLTEATGALLDYTFYETLAEAEAGTGIGISTVTTGGIYYVRGENTAIINSTCFDVAPVVLVLTMPTNIREFPEQKIEDGVFDLSSLPIINLDDPTQSLSVAGYYRDSLLTQELPSPIVMEQDTYWVEIIVGACPVPKPIIVRPESNATFAEETDFLSFPCLEEDGINLPLEILGTPDGVDTTIFDVAFFREEDDAEKGINPIPSTDLIIIEEDSIWLRKSDKTDSNIFGLIELILTERAVAEGGIISMDKETCAEDILEFQFTGSAPFDVRYTDGIDTFDIIISSTDTAIVSPISPTTYTIVSITDSFGCEGVDVGNTPTFTPVISLNFDNPVTECDNDVENYTVSFNILSGDFPSLVVEGIDTDGNVIDGFLVDSQFISNPIPISVGYSFTITDRNHFGIGGTDNCDARQFSVPNAPVCTCDSEAAEMDQRIITACVGVPITAMIDKQEVIADNNDRTIYVLHEGDANEIINRIATNTDEPTFTMTPDLAGTRLYISAVTTNSIDLIQTPALTLSENRCLQVAIGTPVDVIAIPTVNISLEKDTICFGEIIDVTFEMPEAGPFSLSFFDGTTTMDLTNVRNGDTRSVSTEMATTLEVTSISYSSFSSCVNDTPNATATLEVFDPITILNTMINCEDDGENFTVSFEIVGGDPASYTVNGSSDNINGNLFESDFIRNQTNYSFSVSDRNACMAAEVADFGRCDCTSDITANIEVIQEISCPGESDGILNATGNNGELPYSFEWSTGTIGEQLNGVGAGWIYVSMTDGNLCEVIDSIELSSPDPITAMVRTNDPSCTDLENGSIIINNVQGGTRPYNYSINGETPKSVGLFANLSDQEYELLIIDDQGCELEEMATIVAPTPLNIWFDPSSHNIVFGDSVALTVNGNEDSLSYAWQNHPSLSCTNCSSPIVRPTETTTYSVTVTNQNDCVISRDILVEVDNSKDLYSPTAFSPNGDGVNDTFGIFGGNQVREIVRLEVFNRWGALLYSRTNLPTTDNFEDGWDGTETNGERAPSGIYIYVAEIIYTDGTSEIVTGDVALMR